MSSETNKIKMCESCNKPCRPFMTPQSGLEHSEWYCENCHKSYPMQREQARILNILNNRNSTNNVDESTN